MRDSKNKRNILFSLFLGTYLLLLVNTARGNDLILSLMPVPEKVTPGEGRFRIDDALAVGPFGYAGERAKKAAVRFMERLAGRTGIFFKQSFITAEENLDSARIRYKHEFPGKLEPGEDESYVLKVTPDRVMLVAKTDIGVIRGFETLLQLVASDQEGYFLPCAQVEDRPRFTWRGLLIDSGRHFMPLDVIKRNLDGMAAVKMNVLHWHLTEDQGFRIECKTFPRLHEMGSDGLYYTQEQIKEVIAYAADRGIRVMPEFDIPGHSTSWFVGYPELASAPGPYQIERKWGVFDPAFNPADEKIYEFFDRFFQEMSSLFPDGYIHIGGDENSGKHWNANLQVKAFKEAKNIPDNNALQAFFNLRILEVLTKYEKKMVGWDEIFQPGLPKDIVIHSWRGQKSLFESAQQGYPGILSNGYYIDLCQPAEFHYLNDPLPENASLSEDEKKNILGGEATMWSEYVSPETIDSRIWPRTAAIAERLWSPQNIKDVADMYRRLDVIGLQLEEFGLTHYKNQDMMLMRLARREDIGPLKTFIEVIEPVKLYQRHHQGVTYTQFSPLTRVVDAAFPESKAARIFRNKINEFLKEKDVKLAEELKVIMTCWKDNYERLKPLIESSPVLKEIEPLSSDLSLVSEAGLQALDLVLAGSLADSAWADKTFKILAEAKKPKGHAELAVVAAIENLANAAKGF